VAAAPSGLSLTPLIIIIIIIIIHQPTTSPVTKTVKIMVSYALARMSEPRNVHRILVLRSLQKNRLERLKGMMRIELR
jgi:hypothetical protein